MEKKLNKKKVVILIAIILILIITPTLGRYIYNSFRDMYLRSQNFSFSSNLLTTSNKTYRYSSWSGIDNFEIGLQLYSYKYVDELIQYAGQGLEYSIECTVDNENKAKCYITTDTQPQTSSPVKTATKTSHIPNSSNIENASIYLVPGDDLQVGDIIELTVIAKSVSPYVKTISATFRVEIVEPNVSLQIDDSVNSLYATLKLTNTKSTQTQVTLSYDPTVVFLDKLSEIYTKNSNNLILKTISGIEYISGITFTMLPEETQSIKFYKTDRTKDYTYKVGSSGQMIIKVEESN